jgi:hypothetical protein
MTNAQNELHGEVYTLAEHEENLRRLKRGEITGEEWKAAYERLKASKHSIIAELRRKTLKQLASRGGRGDKKATVIGRVWEQMLQRYALGRAIAYSPFPNPERALQEAVDAAVAKITDATLQKYAKDLRRNAAAFKKALENPETLEEFETFIRFKGVKKLRPKQAAFYRELKARAQVESLNRYGDPKTIVEGSSQEVHLAGPFSIHHPEKNTPLWIVKIDRKKYPEKLPLTLFKELCRNASMFGGWWSSNVPEQAGFQFKTVEAARHFMAFVTGSVDRANFLAPRKRRDVEAADTVGTKAEALASGADGAEVVPLTTAGA